MKPRSAKNKGKKLQNWVRDRLSYYFSTLKGVIVDEDLKSTTMGESGEDIQLSPLAKKHIPYSFECKSLKAIAVYKYYEQCLTNCDDRQPVVIMKANGKKPLALIDADHFMELISEKS